MKKSFSQIVREAGEDLQRRLTSKVPEWASVPGLRLPARLSVEQCSSSATARCKAALAGTLTGPGGRIADLTGGLGVDCWAFSAVAREVLYNEADPVLCETVRHNFGLLGLDNVVWRCAEIRPGNVRSVLDGFAPDLIYLDPARRSAVGRKVFLLEDCSPDLAALQDELTSLCPHVLAKVSPMADITLLRRRLDSLKAVHILSVGGECKELLLQLEASGDREFTLTVNELEEGKIQTLPFCEEDLRETCPGVGGQAEMAGAWLFEPGAALGKSGCHAAACGRAGLRKLAPSTHLYLADAPVPSLAPFGRFRPILEVLPLDKRTMAEAGRRYPQADVTARNIPLSSEELARRLGVRSGGGIHIYGTALDSRRVLIITGFRVKA